MIKKRNKKKKRHTRLKYSHKAQRKGNGHQGQWVWKLDLREGSTLEFDRSSSKQETHPGD
jgi:hypothetical protein